MRQRLILVALSVVAVNSIGTDIDVHLKGFSSLKVLTPRHLLTEVIPSSTPRHRIDRSAGWGMQGAVSKQLVGSKVAEATRYGKYSPGGIFRCPQPSNRQEYALAAVGVRMA